MVAVKGKVDIVELEKAISQARLRKLKLDLHIKRLGLQQAEDAYVKKGEKVMRVWQRQWDAIAGAAGKQLYAAAQRGLAVKAWFESEKFIGKSVYDIPDRYRRPIERAVSITPQTSGLVTATFLHLNDVYNRSAQGMSDAFGFKVAFQLRDRDILKSLSDRANYMAKTVSDTTFNRLKHRLATSYFVEGKHPTLRTIHPVSGAKLSSVAEDISGFFDGQVARAKTVARTETMAVQSDSEFEFNKRVGVKRHGWISTRDTIVRPEHRRNDGQEVEIGKKFSSGQIRVGEGSPDLTINCRCLEKRQLIETPNGWVQIQKLKAGDVVYGYKEGKVVETKVKNLQRNNLVKSWMKIRVDCLGYGHRFGEIVITPDHKIRTKRGWIVAGEVKKGDILIRAKDKLNEIQRQVLLGSLLGDSSINISRRGKRIRVVMLQSWKQRMYLRYKLGLMGDLKGTLSSMWSGFGSKILRYGLRTSDAIEEIREFVWDEKKHKYVNMKWLGQLSGLGLAMWYCDDGSLNRGGVLISFKRTIVEGKIVEKYLSTRFGKAKPQTRYGQVVAYRIPVKESKKFFAEISQYVPECMRYKLPIEFREKTFVDYGGGKLEKVGDEVAVIEVETGHQNKEKRFNIETDTGNYFTRVGLVKNCSNYPVLTSKEHAGLLPWDGAKEMPPPPVEFATSDEWVKSTSRVERSAIAEYTRFGYKAVNSLQRDIASGKLTAAKIAKEKALAGAFRDMQLMETTLAKAPKYTKPDLYRAVKFDPIFVGKAEAKKEYGKFVSNLKVGSDFTSTSFMSTSKRRGLAVSFTTSDSHNVVFKIMSTAGKKGVDIGPLSAHAREDEVLFMRGARFKVDSIADIIEEGRKIKLVTIHEI